MRFRRQPNPLFFGLETELALFGTTATGAPVAIESLLNHLESTASRHLHHVRDGSSAGGMFLGNGGRFYRDAGGGHLELCTPEVDHPDELVTQVLAGERLMLELAGLAEGSDHFKEIHLSAANHCYHTSHSWGHHENYSGRVRPDDMTSFLATRFIVDGGGGFVNRSNLITFTISPRIHFISVPTGTDTQRSRSLHNLKDEALGDRPRTHVITADGIRSPQSLWLRFATAALVVGVSDLGLSVPEAARLKNPVEAAHRFALDPTFATRQQTLDGPPRTAIEIQRIYLEWISSQLRHLPDWAPLACQRWAEVLALLESKGWESLQGRLDWCIKKGLLFDRHIERAGWTWEKVASWNSALAQFEARLARECNYRLKLGRALVENPDPLFQKALHTGMLPVAASGHEQLLSFASLREELRALDLKYMLIGKESLFEVLGALGLLDRRLQCASEEPPQPFHLPLPPRGRAKLRGQLVREHGGNAAEQRTSNGRSYSATWSQFIDLAESRIIDMPDVRQAKWIWRTCAENPRQPPSGISGLRRVLRVHREALSLERAVALARNALEGASDLASGVRALDFRELPEAVANLSRPQAASYWRCRARIQAKRQNLDETLAALSRLAEVEDDEFQLLCDQSNLRNALTLRFHDSAPAAVTAMEDFLERNPEPDFPALAAWRAHTAAALTRGGNPTRARELLELTLAHPQSQTIGTAVLGRTRLALAESLRLSAHRQDLGEARRLVDETLDQCRRDSHQRPFHALTLLHSAKIRFQLGESSGVVESLREALEIQNALGRPSALRSYYLIARIDRSLHAGARRALRHEAANLISNCTAFHHCPLVRKILFGWEAWCSGADEPDSPAITIPDHFWGV